MRAYWAGIFLTNATLAVICVATDSMVGLIVCGASACIAFHCMWRTWE